MSETLVDLVADLGEGYGSYRVADDEALLKTVTSANIACGFHAGDPRVMDATVRNCVDGGVSIGAHPGFPDLNGFGRRAMELSEHEVLTDVLYQLGALSAFCRRHGTRMNHVAPHGRLGNLVQTRTDYARAVIDATECFDPSLIVVGQEGELVRLAKERGLRTAIIGIIDRAYEDDGSLVLRSKPGAIIHESQAIVEQAVRMVREGVVRSIGGVDIPVSVDSLLLHGDNAGAVDLARLIHRQLVESGVRVAPLPEVIAARTAMAES